MKKTLLLYGLFLGVVSMVLKATEYWFWVKLNAFEIYGGLIALIFLGVGVWLGIRLNEKNKDKLNLNEENRVDMSAFRAITPSATERASIILDEKMIDNLGISKREYEVLKLLGTGMSNQEIANTLFVSQNTIKTHTSRLFEKLAVKNRTQAILKSKELGIISG